MFPVIFRIGNFAVTSFGVMMFFSFIAGATILGRQLERYQMKRELAWDMLALIAIGGILGAKIYYLALHWSDVVADPVHELLSRGGLVWYGGFIGGVTAYWYQIRRHKLPMATMFDATAPALAVAYAVGRVGCFLVGDDYGVPTDSWVGIAFPHGSPPSSAGYLRSVGVTIPADIPNSQIMAVHPTQLYEVGLGMLMFALLWRLGRKPHRQGQQFALFMILYAIERFAIEFVRAKGDRVLLGLSTSQIASILLLALGSFLWVRQGNHAPAAPLIPQTAKPRQKAAAG
jgi:phosphatidylglycerol---prolipoprotein diacylglyceryl transferase